MLLNVAGDISYVLAEYVICKDCLKTIRRTQQQEKCEQCNNIFHLKCLIDSTETRVEKLICRGCLDVRMENAKDNLLPANDRYLNDFLRCRGMKLLHQNINGLYLKIDQLRDMFEETKKNIHTLGITEPHVN